MPESSRLGVQGVQAGQALTCEPAPPNTSVHTQEHWVHESGQPVQRAEMMQVLQSLEAVLIQTVYNTKMASVGLSDIAMDTTVTYSTSHGRAHSVEECRCPIQQGP